MARRNRTLSLIFFLIVLAVLWFWRLKAPSPHVGPGPLLDTLDGCPMDGDASSSAVRELNRVKNRYEAPQPQQLNSAVTLAALLEPGDDRGRWNENLGAQITGYVWDVKVGGVETVNCHATDPLHRDTHIELVQDPMTAGEDRRVIVEVTPRMRKLAEQRGEDWSTPSLRDNFQGRWVRVTGWLLFDSEHAGQSLNTAPGRPRDWRATAWEIHPVTSLEIVSSPR